MLYLQAEELEEEKKVVEKKYDEYEQDSSDEEVSRSSSCWFVWVFNEQFSD